MLLPDMRFYPVFSGKGAKEELCDGGLFIEETILNNAASAELVETFLNRFWDYKSSPYVETKRAMGRASVEAIA
jgi:hypothetical protein